MAKQKKKNKVAKVTITERGERLDRINHRRQDSNVMSGTQFTTEEGLILTVGSTCEVCGFRVRGINHEEGDHHKKTVARHKRK